MIFAFVMHDAELVSMVMGLLDTCDESSAISGKDSSFSLIWREPFLSSV